MPTQLVTNTDKSAAQRELQKQLIDCALNCESCETACLNEDNLTLLARCIELTRDCADICLQASRLLKRESEISDDYLLICEKACRMCAEECRKHHHEHCRICAEVCEACADACRVG